MMYILGANVVDSVLVLTTNVMGMTIVEMVLMKRTVVSNNATF